MAVTSVNTFGLSEEQLLMRESVLDLLERVLPAEKIRQLDRSGEFPHDAFQALARAGWLGIIYPEKYGGMGGSYKDLAVLIEAMSYHYGGIATAFLNTVIYAGMHVNLHARPELASVVIPEVIRGEAPMSVAITEPGTGSDVARITTQARRDGDHYVINGTKMYITCAHVARYIVVVTKTDAAEAHRGVTLFLVDTRTPGLTVRPLETLGRHTTHTNEVVLENVRVPAAWMLGEENRGWHNLMRCLNTERMALAAVSAGNAYKIVDYTVDYAKQRIAFGQPLSKFQVLQHKMADMRIMAETARLFVYRVAELLDGGQSPVIETAMAKTIATENNFKCADIGMQIMGGAGYTMEYDMQMFFRDARIGPIGGGSNEIQRNIIAKQMGL